MLQHETASESRPASGGPHLLAKASVWPSGPHLRCARRAAVRPGARPTASPSSNTPVKVCNNCIFRQRVWTLNSSPRTDPRRSISLAAGAPRRHARLPSESTAISASLRTHTGTKRNKDARAHTVALACTPNSEHQIVKERECEKEKEGEGEIVVN